MPSKTRPTANGHEVFCLSNADHFIAVRGRTPSARTCGRKWLSPVVQGT